MPSVPTLAAFHDLEKRVIKNHGRLLDLELDSLGLTEDDDHCGVLVPVEDLTAALKLLERARVCLSFAIKFPGPEPLQPRFPVTLRAIDEFFTEIGGQGEASEIKEVG